MMGPLVRILLRYGSGFLIAKGFLAPEIGLGLADDPDVQQIAQIGAGLLAGVLSEMFYFFAKRLGLKT